MGFRFRKSIKLIPGVRLNLNKKSTSITFGGKGAKYTISSTGKETASIGIPGTGISYSETINRKLQNHSETAPIKSSGGGIILALLFLLFLVVLFVGISTIGSRSLDDESVTTNAIQAESSITTTAKYENELASMVGYKAGMYKVGVDIPAGEYFLVKETGKSSAYYCVSNDSNQNDIVDNGVFSTFIFLTVENGQYLQLKDILMTSIHNLDIINFSSSISETIHDGMYRVGIDIPSGEYNLIQGNNVSSSAYYCIYDSSKASKKIIDNGLFDGNSYVTVYDGQYLLLQRCKTNIIKNRTPLEFEHIYSSGEYVVGENIPSGEYYVELKSDYGTVYTYNPNDLTNSLMTSVETHYYVTLSDGYMVRLSGVTATPVSEVSKKYNSDNLSPGLYRVGIDIKAGTYKCTPVSSDEMGKWESFYFVYDSSNIGRNTIAENFIGASDTVTVEEGQYLDLTSCTASLMNN